MSNFFLPEVYMITHDDFDNVQTLKYKVESQLRRGVRLVQLRMKKTKAEPFEYYAKALVETCNKYSAKLVLNHRLRSLPDVDCFGIHITSHELMKTKNIPDEIRSKYKISSPIHNYHQLDRAIELNLDFAVLTPIQKSISHPDAMYIGWKNAECFPKKTDIPLYAAGGMGISDIEKAKNLGFVGIASLGALWR